MHPALATLLGDYRFAAVESVLPFLDLGPERARNCEALALAGDRLLDLDAEDFDELIATGVLPRHVVAAVRAAQFPRSGRRLPRGSLADLRPLYLLMLEALAVRWRRREPIHVIMLLHLMAEYLPLLAWQPVLRHAGDPALLAEAVAVPGSRWGSDDPHCDHTPSLRSAARRALRAADDDDRRWAEYLNRFHSRVSDALAVCAVHPELGKPVVDGACRQPCRLWFDLPEQVRGSLSDRVRLGGQFGDSEVVALRHHAPVGHFFGVPDLDEIAAAWTRSVRLMARPWEAGTNPLPRRPAAQPDEPLPGLAAVVTAVAGATIRAGTVLRTVRDALAAELD